MVYQVTHNIKVSVRTTFEGVIYRYNRRQHAFSYHITIENLGTQTVQLLSRYWHIQDVLNVPEIVEGDGVIGLQPLIPPGESHQYSSGCMLVGPTGSMRGHYIMRTADNSTFQVTIPIFRLNAPYAMN